MHAMSYLVKVLAFLVLSCGSLLHLLRSLKGNQNVGLSEDVSIIVGITGLLIAVVRFFATYDQWSNFFNLLSDFRKFGKPSTFDVATKKMNYLSKMFSCYVTLGIPLYAITSLIESTDCKELNEKYDLHEICGTFTPMWLPFGSNNSITSWTVFSVQIIAICFSSTPSAMICFLTMEATEMLVTHISFLKEKLVNVIDGSDTSGERFSRIRFCVTYHNHILRMANELNKLVKLTVGHCTLIAAIVFGSIGNHFLKSKLVTVFLFLTGWMISLFLVCYSGQRITDEALSIGNAVYSSEWYESDPNSGKDLNFIIFRSQKMVTFDALPLGTLNYPLFVLILKTSYSYLTLLSGTT